MQLASLVLNLGNQSSFSKLLILLVLSCMLSSIHLAEADSVLDQTTQSKTVEEKLVDPKEEIRTIDWIDLLPTDINRKALMEHYADLIIQRLDPPDDLSLQEQIITELKQAPVNPSLAGVKLRLAGYMIVLDEFEGKITEFLLVPYSGAGVHQPAPPANQMLLVRLNPEQALATAQMYESVWVEGRLKIQPDETSIARVAYRLEDAQVRLYTMEDARQAEAREAKLEHEDAATHAHEE
jgi:hypothetical protein